MGAIKRSFLLSIKNEFERAGYGPVIVVSLDSFSYQEIQDEVRDDIPFDGMVIEEEMSTPSDRRCVSIFWNEDGYL